MRLEWIAAVLRPADIAPHHSFRNSAYDSLPHVTLAAAVMGKEDHFRAWPEFVGDEESPPPPDKDRQVANAAIKTLHADSIRDGVNEIRRLVTQQDVDVAVAVAATLLAACALSELEDYEGCEALVTDALDRLDQHDSAEIFLRACLLQQLCLRRRDWAVDYTAQLQEAYQLLLRLGLDSKFPSFALGPSAIGDSDQTLRHILVALRYAVWSISPGEFDTHEPPPLPNLASMFKFDEPDELLHRVENAANEYRRSFEDQFRFFFDDTATYMGRSLPELFYYNLAYELYGHGAVYQTRKELALFNLTQAATIGRPIDASDCLRLLRYSNADQDLELAVKSLRLGGPLAALSKDARQAIAKRMTSQRVRHSDLIVIRAAAEVLTDSEAAKALDAGFELIDAGSKMNVVGRWTAFSKRLETTWRTIAALANVANRSDRAAQKLLQDLHASEYDEDLDRVYARTIRVLDWSQVADDAKANWRRWLAEQGTKWIQTGDLARLHLGMQSSPPASEELRMTEIANLINDTAIGYPIPPQLMVRCASRAREALERLHSTSIGGPWGRGGLDIADIAANLVIQGAAEVEEPLAALLVDTRVPRTYRSGALDRLASTEAVLDHDSLNQFRSKATEMLWAPDTLPMEGDSYIPHPAALRFLGFHQLISEQNVFRGITHLAGSPDRAARAEAARTVSIISNRWESSVLLSVAIQLTYDTNADTRGYATHALASLVGKDAQAARLGAQRLRDLLDADGIIVPLLAIRGLGDATPEFAQQFTKSIATLADNHPSRLVRDEARALLD